MWLFVFSLIWQPMTLQGFVSLSLEERAWSPLSREGTGACYLTFPRWQSRTYALSVRQVTLGRLLITSLSYVAQTCLVAQE